MSLSIVFLNFSHLSARDRNRYRPFIDKPLWVCLKGRDPWGISDAEIFGLAVLNGSGNPVGLCVVTYYRSNFLAQLLSFRISEEYSSDEIYIQVFDKLREKLLVENCSAFSYSYSTLDPHAPKIEALFKDAGAGVPRLILVRCHFDLQAFAPAWLNYYKKNDLPKRFAIFPWKKMTSEDHRILKEQQNQGRFISSVSPFLEENRCDITLSLAARIGNEIVGWIIIHRIAHDTLRFSTFYVDRDFRTSDVSAWLLAEAIILAQKTKTGKAFFEFNLDQVDRSWIDLVKKRLAPFAMQIERIYEIGIAMNSESIDMNDNFRD